MFRKRKKKFKNVMENGNISIFTMYTVHIVLYMCTIQNNNNNKYILKILAIFIMRGFDIMII